jgi:SOS-response transcriptional repressor LexA
MPPRSPRSHSELGRRIAEALRAMSMTQVAFAQRVGVHETAVSKWAAGRPPSGRLVPRIASVLGVSIEFLMTGKERTQVTREVDGDARAIPLVAAAAAGEPLAKTYEAGEVQIFHFPREFIRQFFHGIPDPERAVLLRVDGDSMADDLKDGALVLIDRGPRGEGITPDKIRPEDIYMVRPPGESGVTLKRLSIHDGRLVLEASNRDRRRFPLRSYSLKGLKIPQIVRGRVVGKIERL